MQNVQATSAIQDQWRVHYEQKIAQLQLEKAEAEGILKEELAGYKNKSDVMEEELQAVKSVLESKISKLNNLLKKQNIYIEDLEKDKANLEKQLELEKNKKQQAVNKLAEIMNRIKDRTVNKSENEVSADALRKKEKECRRLQAELQQEKEKWGSISYKHQQNIIELQGTLAEESARCNDLQMALDSKDSDIEMLTNQLQQVQATSVGSASSINGDDGVHDNRLQGWLSIPNKSNIKRHGYWKRQYVVVSKKNIIFYDSEQDKNESNPSMVLDLDKLFYVRPLTQAEAIRVKPEDIPKTFQVLYANERESRRDTESLAMIQDSENKHGDMSHKGHEFIPIMYHLPTNCEVCTKPLWHMFKPPAAVECQRCHTRCHKEHLEVEGIGPCRVNFDINSAKDLLIKASSPEDQKMWVSSLAKKLPACLAPHNLPSSSVGSSSKRQEDVPSDRSRKPHHEVQHLV